MTDFIARLFERLLRPLVPASGRHRAAEPYPGHPYPYVSPYSCDYVGGPAFRPAGESPLRGAALIDQEWRVTAGAEAVRRVTEARRQRARRRALWLAVHGVDVGPRRIHGVEVAV